MVAAEIGTDIPRPLGTAIQACTIGLVTEDIHAIGARKIPGPVAVGIAHTVANRGADDTGHGQGIAHRFSKRERHAVAINERRVSNAGLERSRNLNAMGAVRRGGCGQVVKGTLASLDDVGRGTVAPKEAVPGVVEVGQLPGNAAGEPWVALEAGVFGAAQPKARRGPKRYATGRCGSH